MSNEVRVTKREARERKAAEQRAKAEAARKRATRLRIVAAAAVVLVVVAVVVGLAVGKDKVNNNAALPKGVAAAGGGVVTGSGPVTLDLYEDFQCPSCDQLEKANGPTIQKLAADGKAKVVYHPLSFLDQNLNNDSSLRAANAAACAADQGVYPQYHQVVYDNQPAKEGAGYTTAQLISFGTKAGVKDMTTFTSCVQKGTYNGWVGQVARDGRDKNINQTPSVLLNGKPLDLATITAKDAQGNEAYDPAKLVAVVEAAAK
jgi:protein-disulfide isomerase